jgi:hypothetical protein
MIHDYRDDPQAIVALGLAALAARQANAIPACEDLNSPKARLLRSAQNIGNVITRWYGVGPLSRLDVRFDAIQSSLREAFAALAEAHLRCQPDERGNGPISDPAYVAVADFLNRRPGDVRSLLAAHAKMMRVITTDESVVDPSPAPRAPSPSEQDRRLSEKQRRFEKDRRRDLRRRIKALDEALDQHQRPVVRSTSTVRTWRDDQGREHIGPPPGSGKNARRGTAKPRRRSSAPAQRHYPTTHVPDVSMTCECGARFNLRTQQKFQAVKHFEMFTKKYGR